MKSDRSIHAENMKGFNCFHASIAEMIRSCKTPWDDPMGSICITLFIKITVYSTSSAIASVKTRLPLEQSNSDPKNYSSSPLLISLYFSRRYISELECNQDTGVNEL